MKSVYLWLSVLLTMASAVCASAGAVPKPGHYKGTFTIQTTLLDPTTLQPTNAIVKKVIAVSGILDGTQLQLVFAEKPGLPQVVDVVGKGTIDDDSLTLS